MTVSASWSRRTGEMAEKLKTKCPKCGKVEVMMTWRPTMVGTLALIDECEGCHYRPNPGPDRGAWGFGGGPVPIHYGSPPHDMKLTDIHFRCGVCELDCERHEVELPSEIMKIGTPIYWECPKCKDRIGLKQALDRINNR